jgi:cytochrome c peroxidase
MALSPALAASNRAPCLFGIGFLLRRARTSVTSAMHVFTLVLSVVAPGPVLGLEGESAPALVSLGEHLFYSGALSRDGSVSCGTCHVSSLGFSGDRPLAIGVAGYSSGRRAPSLLGVGQSPHLMWDGRAQTLPSQIAIPLESPEMSVDWSLAESRFRSDPTITTLFERAGQRAINRDSCLNALAAFVASLSAGGSRFDRYFFDHDNSALTRQETAGLRLFTHKARCSGCHLLNGISAPFTDNQFHATGIGWSAGLFKDRGRAGVTGNPADEGAFKTPSLRGVALRPYLMHDGSITSLHDAVEHYNREIGKGRFDERLGPLYLTQDEVDAIVAFLGALTPDNLRQHATINGGENK